MVEISIDPTEVEWFELGLSLVDRPSHTDNEYAKRIFKSHYGVNPIVVMKCWSMIHSLTLKASIKGMKCCHLLWALMFLKAYQTEMLLSSVTKATEKTSRKWVWLIVEEIAALEEHVVCVCLIFASNGYVH